MEKVWRENTAVARVFRHFCLVLMLPLMYLKKIPCVKFSCLLFCRLLWDLGKAFKSYYHLTQPQLFCPVYCCYNIYKPFLVFNH